MRGKKKTFTKKPVKGTGNCASGNYSRVQFHLATVFWFNDCTFYIFLSKTFSTRGWKIWCAACCFLAKGGGTINFFF